MSVTSEIARLREAKSALKEIINELCGSLTDESISDYAAELAESCGVIVTDWYPSDYSVSTYRNLPRRVKVRQGRLPTSSLLLFCNASNVGNWRYIIEADFGDVTTANRYFGQYLTQLKQAEFPLCTAEFEQRAFGTNVALERLAAPGAVTVCTATSATNAAFYGDTSLATVELGSPGHPVSTIGAYAFYNCPALTSVTVYTANGLVSDLANAPWSAETATITYLKA